MAKFMCAINLQFCIGWRVRISFVHNWTC